MVWDASADRPARLGAERAAHLSCNMPGYRTRVAARLKKHTLATYSDDFHPLTGQLSVPSSSNSCCPCPCPCRGTPDERPASHTRSSVCHYHHSPTQDPSERAPSHDRRLEARGRHVCFLCWCPRGATIVLHNVHTCARRENALHELAQCGQARPNEMNQLFAASLAVCARPRAFTSVAGFPFRQSSINRHGGGDGRRTVDLAAMPRQMAGKAAHCHSKRLAASASTSRVALPAGEPECGATRAPPMESVVPLTAWGESQSAA